MGLISAEMLSCREKKGGERGVETSLLQPPSRWMEPLRRCRRGPGQRAVVWQPCPGPDPGQTTTVHQSGPQCFTWQLLGQRSTAQSTIGETSCFTVASSSCHSWTLGSALSFFMILLLLSVRTPHSAAPSGSEWELWDFSLFYSGGITF